MMRRAVGTAASAGISTATGHTRACSFSSLASAVRRPVYPRMHLHSVSDSGLVRCWRTTTVGSFQGIAGARASSSAPIRSGKFAVLQDEDVAFFRWLTLALETPHFSQLHCSISSCCNHALRYQWEYSFLDSARARHAWASDRRLGRILYHSCERICVFLRSVLGDRGVVTEEAELDVFNRDWMVCPPARSINPRPCRLSTPSFHLPSKSRPGRGT